VSHRTPPLFDERVTMGLERLPYVKTTSPPKPDFLVTRTVKTRPPRQAPPCTTSQSTGKVDEMFIDKVCTVCVMARLNVYLPDDLAAKAKAAGLNLSAVTQEAVRQTLAARSTDSWLATLRPAPADVVTHDRARRVGCSRPVSGSAARPGRGTCLIARNGSRCTG
jgi:post-segregation antitoxin (ccd killing protein)